MEKKKYCTFCGAENRAEDMLCHRCQQNLNAEDELLKDFLLERTKDKLKGNLDDSLRDLIMNFLKSHLYGMVFTISLVAAVSVNAIAVTGIQQVTQRPDLVDIPVVNDQVDQNQQDEIMQQERFMNADQLEVKEIVDLYFETARHSGRAEAESLIHYEEFDDPDLDFHFVPSFDVDEVKNIESISLDYHLLKVDSERISYSTSVNQRNAGYSVSEVTLVETLVANGTTTETMFDICLVYREHQWRVLQISDVNDDPKSLYYYEELLWDMMYETISGLDDYFLPDEFGYYSDEDVKETISLDMNVLVSWFEGLGQRVSTQMSDQLVADGYRIAQAILDDENSNRQIVFTFVNAAGDWYVAEIVEKAGE